VRLLIAKLSAHPWPFVRTRLEVDRQEPEEQARLHRLLEICVDP